jgi:hypothetical protein
MLPEEKMSASPVLAQAITAFQSCPTQAPLTRKAISEIMDKASVGQAWHWRSAYDAIEAAAATRFQRHGRDAAQLGPDAFFGLAERLQAWVPTQTIRSIESQQRELFTTPPVLGAAVGLLTQARPEHRVLEPSAGNGGLAGPISAFSNSLWLNELDTASAERLRDLFPNATVTSRDAAVIDALTAPHGAFDRVALNPPFRFAESHLRAAFSSLLSGGALIALLPARFRDQALFEPIVGPEGRVDLHLALAPRLFAHAGVSTETVLVRIVKAPGPASAVLEIIADADALQARVRDHLDRGTPDGLDTSDGLDTGAPVKPATPRPTARPATQPVRASSGSGRILRPPLPGVPLAYDTCEPRPAERAGDSPIYARYQPSRITFENAHPHAGSLVETFSMASVPMPPAAYQPRLPARLVKTGALSTAQLEAILYAGQAHTRYIPGAFVPSEPGTDLLEHAHGADYRYGFFLGDGTGVGKGRTVAGIIMDNLCQGRAKALWVSESATLIEDARRDWCDLGGRPKDVIDLKAVSANHTVDQDGIFFLTYATLRRQASETTRARLNQVLELLGPDFDGVIVFDEAHAMGSAIEEDALVGKAQASQTGLVGLKIQNALPNARIVYASATGASHVRNIAYATRLGLWGSADTPFESRSACLSNLSSGGPAALELLVRELKGRGLFLARSLSYEGVEYAPLVHDFSADDTRVWDEWSKAWTIIHHHLEKALKSTGIVSPEGGTQSRTAKAAARSAFESTKLRFFSHLLQSIQAPTLIAAMKNDIAAGCAPVVQVASTNEAILDRRISAADSADPADLDFTPREYVLDYLERAFPLQKREPVYEDGKIVDARLMVDEDGNPVLCPQALAARGQLIEHLVLLPECLGALDQLVQYFGPNRIAECTGRTRRLVWTKGQKSLDARGSNANTFEASRFMAGTADALVFSNAGGTGRSYHASRAARNQKRRVHYLIEPGWQANRAIQGLGRSHRNNQVQAPVFRVLTTDLAGQRRFTSTISQRLETLGAFTKADRRSAGEQLFSPLDNLEGDLPQQAYRCWISMLAEGKSTISLSRFEELTGLCLVSEEGEVLAESCPITRWLNRILALPVATQNAIFNEFYGLLESATEAARDLGALDREIEAIKADTITLVERHELPADRNGFLPAYVSVFETRTRPRPVPYSALPKAEHEIHGRYVCRQSGQLVLTTMPRLAAGHDGTPYLLVTCYTPHSRYFTKASRFEFGVHFTAVEQDRFEAMWNEAAARPVKDVVDRIYMLHGACLHLWRSFTACGIRVRRIADGTGETVIGRLLDADQASQLADIKSQAPLEAVVTRIAQRSSPLQASDGTGFSKIRHMDRDKLQIHNFDRAQTDFYRSLGADVAIHNYSAKLLVPWEQAEAFLAALRKSRPGLRFEV